MGERRRRGNRLKTFEQLSRIDFRLSTEHDKETLPRLSYSTIEAINACPLWGVVRYGLGKKLSEGRAMALEAGSACHDVFAAVRLLQVREAWGDDIFNREGYRLFPSPGRFDTMRSQLENREDSNTRELNFALSALHTGPFYDDPRDKRRTVVNLEEACIAYYDRYNFNIPVHVSDTLVGIEQKFDLTVTCDDQSFRYVGVIDGIHDHKEGPRPHENKTASRLGDAWFSGMEMSHQVTGYIVACRLLTNTVISKAVVHGLSIPLPKNYDGGGVLSETVFRNDDRITDWLRWLWDGYQMFMRYRDEPLKAPQYTRSCNRYFSACSFIPMCDAPANDRQGILDEMYKDDYHEDRL